MADAAYVNFWSSEDCNSFTKTVNIPTGCSNVGASALSWEIYGSGCTVQAYGNVNCQDPPGPTQSKYVVNTKASHLLRRQKSCLEWQCS
ncbi:hypothetical protein PG996_015395 [Apiospora saccharicola]|uniref:Uncharacterized protein n=1 Tax=Apiospora saccharicola TaxID=335842 RepID=A0ABR1TN72_9PEZI